MKIYFALAQASLFLGVATAHSNTNRAESRNLRMRKQGEFLDIMDQTNEFGGTRPQNKVTNRKLVSYPSIQVLGGNPVEFYPLGVCMGDCDEDSQCEGELICFQRDANTAVPGCEGGLEDNSRTDYCIYPPGSQDGDDNDGDDVDDIDDGNETDPTLPQLVSFGGNPVSQYPLGLCEGDCDDNSQCEGELICFQRDPNMAVPGCQGGLEDNSRTDYCIHPSALDDDDDDGDDYDDADDVDDVDDVEAPSAAPSMMPSASPAPSNAPTPKGPKEVEWLGVAPNDSYPLQRCQGDCDIDSHCREGLICFERNGDEPVPGCFGSPVRSGDYCIDPADLVV